MKTMMKDEKPLIEVPFVKVKEINVQIDEKGTMRVAAIEWVPEVKRGFRPSRAARPMDSREMVLALIRVVQEYTAVIFAGLGEGPIGAKPDEKGQTASTNNDNTGKPA
jgi:hypothetical protein